MSASHSNFLRSVFLSLAQVIRSRIAGGLVIADVFSPVFGKDSGVDGRSKPPDGPTVQVRAARPGDAETVARLELECLGTDAWSAGLVHEGIVGALPTVTYLVAVRLSQGQELVVGHSVVSVAGDIAELQRIAVEGRHRRAGVASALLASVAATAQRAGADRLLLEVREDNPGALTFYVRRGFTRIARRPRYFADGAPALVLRLGLGHGFGHPEADTPGTMAR